MIFSKYQTAVEREVKEGTGNVSVLASAGAGKTSTIVRCSASLPKWKKSIFLSFSKAIVDELKERIPGHVKASTLHSLGAGMVYGYFKGVKLEEDKYFKLAMSLYPKESWKDKVNAKEQFKHSFWIQDICNYARMTLCRQNEPALKEMCGYYNLDFNLEVLEKSIQLLAQSTTKVTSIDFTDMIYLPVALPHLIGQKYDYILWDECQDANNCQIEFVSLLMNKESRLIAVGDDQQCQPTGTMITMSDLTQKPIESLSIGDVVVSYNKEDGRGFRCVDPKGNDKTSKVNKSYIKNIASRNFNGNLIKITTESGYQSKYTPNHICYARLTNNVLGAQVMYMMERNGCFRIGIAPYWCVARNYKNNFTSRANQEKADKMWILNIYDKRRDAFLDEQYYSSLIGIPQLRFHDNKTGLFNQEELNALWERFDKTEMKNRAIKLLSIFNKEYDYPIWQRGNVNYFSKNHLRPIHACNLFHQYMEVVVFDERNQTAILDSKKNNYKRNPIFEKFNLEYEPYNGKVYSLDVAVNNNYVADSILTHNCIYAFAGSSVDSFQKIVDRFKCKVFMLPISYRCSVEVVNFAQDVFKENNRILPFDGAKQGHVGMGSIDQIQEGDMVLCRNTLPLFHVFFELINSGIKATIIGKDIESGLIEFAKKVIGATNDDVELNMNRELQDLKDSLKELHIVKPEKHPKYIALVEKIQVLSLILRKVVKPNDLIGKIHEIFAPDKKAARLMTGHRSKGLESKRVFVIESYFGKQLIPSSFAEQPHEILQETNLMFVMYTRAKEEMYLMEINA